ncbi:MAG TPA: DUF481 domain-containing protein [Puia sp.]|nr:DUF481 domain-containing protein [Puia sp.]
MKIIILLLLFSFPLLLYSQNNKADSTHKAEQDSTHHTDTVHYHYYYTGTGTYNNTSSGKSYVVSNAFKFSVVKQSAVLNLNNNWLYGQQAGTLTNNDFTSTFDVGLYKSLKHFYYWGLANYTTSYSLKVNHQEQGGLGIGYNLIDKKKALLILSNGILYERGDLYDSLYGGPGGNVFQRDRYQTVRNSFRILYHWIINDIFFLDGTGFYQNALSNSQDYIVKLNASASVRLQKWLSFTIAATYNKFNRTRSENTLVTFGLTVQK